MSQRILLVDDEPDLLRALSIRLVAQGYVCDTASQGVEALERIEQHLPDLILADLLMPVMDGYELCHRLRADPRTAAIPIVIVTAVPERAMRCSAEKLGASYVIHKPFDAHKLIKIVQKCLSGIQPAPRSQASPSSSQS